MHGPAWIGLLRKFPAALHDGMVLVMTNSAEVIVQAIVRAERDYLVIRGRNSGSTDAGRVMCVPFDQISFVTLTKRVSEAELQIILNKSGPPPLPGAEGAPDEAAAALDFEPFIPERPPEELAPAEPAAQEGAARAAPTGKKTSKVTAPSKSVLLARLRARLGGEETRQPEA